MERVLPYLEGKEQLKSPNSSRFKHHGDKGYLIQNNKLKKAQKQRWSQEVRDGVLKRNIMYLADADSFLLLCEPLSNSVFIQASGKFFYPYCPYCLKYSSPVFTKLIYYCPSGFTFSSLKVQSMSSPHYSFHSLPFKISSQKVVYDLLSLLSSPSNLRSAQLMFLEFLNTIK